MTGYRVTWEIDVEADSYEAAAAEAHRLVRKPDTTANVYEVIKHDDAEIVKVDLSEVAGERPTFSIKILWGSQPEPGQEPSFYEFGSQDELDTFMDGVEQASGWLDYEVVTDEDEDDDDDDD